MTRLLCYDTAYAYLYGTKEKIMQNNPGPNDPTYTPQPYPSYPGQSLYPPGPPPRKRRTWLWIVLGVFALVVLGCVGILAASQGATSIPPAATQAPAGSTPATGNTPAATTAPATWHTIKTFTGNGTKKTETFTVPDTWRIVWTCHKDISLGVDNILIVDVNSSDGSPIDIGAVNATCNKATVSDNTIEHQGGSVYLSINGSGEWKIEVQTQQ